MEIEVLKTLRFELGRPLSINFLRRNSKVGVVSLDHHTLAKFILELSLVEYALAHIDPSCLAASALLIGLFVIDGKVILFYFGLSVLGKLLNESNLSAGAPSVDEVWSPNLSFYSGYTSGALKPVVKQLAEVLLSAEKSNFKTVVNKYKQRAKHLMLTLNTETSQRRLQTLADID